MIQVVRGRSRFRIQIYDLKRRKSKTMSIKNGDGYELKDICKKIEEGLTKKE